MQRAETGRRLSMKNLYHTLGIKEDAGAEEIKKAFRMLAKQSHPDISKGDSEKFREITHAYKILSNPEARKDYDRTLGNFHAQTGDFTNYTQNSYTVHGKDIIKLIKEIMRYGFFTDIKISYKDKFLFSMSLPAAAGITLIGLIKAPILFLIGQAGLSAIFNIEVNNQIVIMFNEAVEYHNLGRIAAAEELYKKILERSEYFIPARLNLGILYRQRGNDRMAVQCFRQVLEISPYGSIGEAARKNLSEIRGF
jgi:curved DNA-binding protein CbpA